MKYGKSYLSDIENPKNVNKQLGLVAPDGTITSRTVGELSAGTDVSGLDVYQIVMNMITKTTPSITEPSITVSGITSGLYEINTKITPGTCVITFNRGSINPQYTTESPYRAGLPTKYIFYTNTANTWDAETITTSDLTVTNAINGTINVIDGSLTWTITVNAEDGPQPKDLNGNDYDSPWTGSVSRTITISGAYPTYATTNSIGTATKQQLKTKNTTMEFKMVAETATQKQRFYIPSSWNNVTGVSFFDIISGTYKYLGGSKSASLTYWNKEINISGSTLPGNPQTTYTKYTNNDVMIGARNLKIEF